MAHSVAEQNAAREHVEAAEDKVKELKVRANERGLSPARSKVAHDLLAAAEKVLDEAVKVARGLGLTITVNV